jgi:hypothetical protein
VALILLSAQCQDQGDNVEIAIAGILGDLRAGEGQWGEDWGR